MQIAFHAAGPSQQDHATRSAQGAHTAPAATRADPIQQLDEANQSVAILARLVVCVALTLGVLALSAQLMS
jgi:hypothetical protein